MAAPTKKDITFSAANTVGLNNPGTEIITLVKDGGGNFINPPSYDKMRAYLRSGEVPMLFVTAEGGKTGSLYQLSEYSETENKIRFSNDANAIEFCARCKVPNVSTAGGGGVTTLNINVTAVNTETGLVTASTADKTPEEMQQASLNGPIWCVVTFAAGIFGEKAVSFGLPPAYSGGGVAFGLLMAKQHNEDGTNVFVYAVTEGDTINPWYIDLSAFES